MVGDSSVFRGLSVRAIRCAFAAAACAALFVAGCGDDENNPAGPGGAAVPAEWAGIWSITTVEKECGSGTVRSNTTETDTLCTGESVTFGDESGITCEGTVTDTSIDVTCTSTYTIEGYTFVITYTFQATRSGDTFSGTGHYTVTQDGVQVDCGDLEITATRTGAAPADCGSMAPSFGWGPRRAAESFLEPR